MMSSEQVGIDVAKATLQVHLLQPTRTWSCKVANTPDGHAELQRRLLKQGVTPTALRVCLEATGGYEEAVATALSDWGCTVYVVNPGRVKHWAQSEQIRTKTDKVDAKILAEYVGRAHKLHAWHPVDPAYRELNRLVRLRQAVTADVTAWTNRRGAPGRLPWEIASCDRLLAALQQELQAIEAEITRVLATDAHLAEDVALADSLIGLGRDTATVLVGEYGNCAPYQHGGQVVADAGLSVVHRNSGTSVHGKPHISKQGNARVRAALYWPAISAWQHDPELKAFGDRLVAKGKLKMQVLCAIMRKLLLRFYAIMRSRVPYAREYQWQLGPRRTGVPAS